MESGTTVLGGPLFFPPSSSLAFIKSVVLWLGCVSCWPRRPKDVNIAALGADFDTFVEGFEQHFPRLRCIEIHLLHSGCSIAGLRKETIKKVFGFKKLREVEVQL